MAFLLRIVRFVKFRSLTKTLDPVGVSGPQVHYNKKIIITSRKPGDRTLVYYAAKKKKELSYPSTHNNTYTSRSISADDLRVVVEYNDKYRNPNVTVKRIVNNQTHSCYYPNVRKSKWAWRVNPQFTFNDEIFACNIREKMKVKHPQKPFKKNEDLSISENNKIE